MMKCQEYSPYVMSQEMVGGGVFSARRYFNIDTVIQGDFKWHITYIPSWYALCRIC